MRCMIVLKMAVQKFLLPTCAVWISTKMLYSAEFTVLLWTQEKEER